MISKGWVYTRPTIDKHHFEFLKCKNRLTLEDNAAAFEVLWEANEGAPFDHTDQSAVFSAIATLPKNQVFASAPSYEP